MKLKDLVCHALVEIAEGVAESLEGVKVAGGNIVGSEAREVEFDVAITALQGPNDHGDVQLEVLRSNNGPSSAGEQPDSSVSRLRFSVPMKLPSMPEPIGGGADSSERKFAPIRGQVIPAQFKK